MYVFRMYIRPKGGTADLHTTFDYCLKNGILGVGWRTPSQQNTKNWDEYYAEASQVHNNLQVCKYIHKCVSEGDLVWTRDYLGQYYLARVTSGWEYWVTEEAKELDIDIANIFHCVFKRVDIDEVPGYIVNCFRARRAIQEVGNDRACEYSRYLWTVLGGQDAYPYDKMKYSDIFMMLDAEETEDLLFLYLQSQGWYVVPHSRKGDTMSFEYLCVNPLTGEKAETQVKTGNDILDKDYYSHYSHKVFLFQSNECYSGTDAANVVAISRQELLRFLDKSLAWLPKSFKRKMELVSQ